VRALRATAAAPHVALREVPEPHASVDEALVRVSAFSLNRGEVLDLARAEPEAELGWDFAGIVDAAAPDGSGPAAGVRAAGLVRRGAWAEVVAAPTSQLAAIPDRVSDAEAATLPTAGLTALRSLELGGFLLGKRALVTGASGAVGSYAVELASLGGAVVTALVRDVAAGADTLQRLGATEVTDRVDGEFDVVVDAVGGATFGAAIEHVAPGGIVVNLATRDAEEVVSFRASQFDRAPGARIYTLNLFDELTRIDAAGALARLLRLLEQHRLVAPIAFEAEWTEIERAIDALLARTIRGKAVLHLSAPHEAV
jgi:NADPH:quinone reductase-like Zn-dependent oxidoreductase